MTTALITTQSGAMGTREELTAYANRIGYMMKGGNKLNENEKMALAQVSIVTGLNPFIGEVWYIPGSGPMVGIAGSRRLDNERVEKKGGYTWETCNSVPPEEAGATEQEIPNVAAAFKVTIHDSTATAQYQALFADTLKMLREANSKDPFSEAKEICGPRPEWVGYGYSLRTETSRMNKIQLARKRAHADGLKKRVIVPFGGEVSERDVAPDYDVDADAIDMQWPENNQEATPPIQQSAEEKVDELMGTKKSKRETEKPQGPVGILMDLGVDNTSHAARLATKLKLTSNMTSEEIEKIYSKYENLKASGKSSDEAAAEVAK